MTDETDEITATEAVPVRTGRGRGAGFAVGRGIVVLVVAAVVYEVVVPSTHTDRSRLARLVPHTSGLSIFAKTSPQAAAQTDTQTGLAAVTAAAKKSPGKTGLYSISWSASETSGAGVIVFLLPDVAAAKATLPQIASQQMSTTTYTANSLERKAVGSVAGIPASRCALYEPSAKAAKGIPSLMITEFRYGEVDAVSEAVGTTSSVKTEAVSLATREYSLLQRQGGRLSLAVTEYPAGATAGWAAGSVVLAAVVAVAPVLRRRRREKQRIAYEEEMANRVVVKGRVIAKRHR